MTLCAERDQLVRDPSGAAAELEDPAARGHRSVDQLRLAEWGERRRETDRAPVRGGGAHARTLSRYRPAVAVATNEYGLFINGETVEGSSSRDLVEPASGEPLGTAQLAGEAEIDRAVEAARAALDGDWGKTPANERSRLLHALADAIDANRKELSELESRNVGKAISSTKAELFGAVENFRFFASAIGSIAGRSNPIGGSLLSYTLKEPVGVAGQIVPWNYPLLMTTWKLAPALAAGCAVVLKPDPQTPLTALRLAELAAEVGFPAGAINIVTGRRPDHRRLPRQASGGRQGRVHRLDEDGRRDHAALLGADQAADAGAGRQEPEPRLRRRRPRLGDPERGLVDLLRRGPELRGALAGPRRAVDLRRLRRRVHREGGPAEGGRPARRRDADGLADLAGAPGARALASSRARARRAARSCSAGEPGEHAFYPPTVVAGVDNASTIAQEEVFGPVVTIIPFEDEKDAIRIANDVKYGLMASVWTGDPARGHRLASPDQGRHRRDQHAVHSVPGPAVRRLQAVRLRPRARDRRARSLPRDEERDREHRLAPDQPLRPVAEPRYRWAVLAAGTVAQAGFSSITFAIAVMAPDLRDRYDLSLTEIGVVLAAEWIGLTVAMLPWGFAADRYGERATLAVGLVGCSGFLAAAAFAPDYRTLVALLTLAGVAGGSVQSGSGRAVMRWFGAHERGLALGVRQTAVPIGGFVAALVVPLLDGPRQGFLFLSAFVLAGAIAGTVVLRSRPESELPETTEVEATLRDTRLLLLCGISGAYVVAQVVLMGFIVLYLHEERGLSAGAAAAALAVSQVVAAACGSVSAAGPTSRAPGRGRCGTSGWR